MTRDDIKPQDHPDFIGGWVWTKLEMRWIEQRIAEAVAAEREACAQTVEGFYGSREEYAAVIRARGQA